MNALSVTIQLKVPDLSCGTVYNALQDDFTTFKPMDENLKRSPFK